MRLESREKQILQVFPLKYRNPGEPSESWSGRETLPLLRCAGTGRTIEQSSVGNAKIDGQVSSTASIDRQLPNPMVQLENRHEIRVGRGDALRDKRTGLGGQCHQFEQVSICRCHIGSMPR